MEERVRQDLQTAFPGAVLGIGRFAGAQRINGYIAWDGFEDWEQMDRQDAIWAALTEHLYDASSAVSVFLTYTLRELELMRAA
ncbi:MAG: hypothetical protein M3Y56_06830 [Armatimonadota bacterium]|nr:hypothetical protein [Armatimonadota bacterium]